MIEYSVAEAAEVAGISAKTFRMHIVRGKVMVTRRGTRVTITADDLSAYMLTERLLDTAAKVQGQPAPVIRKQLKEAFDGPDPRV